MLSKARFFSCISAITANQHLFQGKILILYIGNHSQPTSCQKTRFFACITATTVNQHVFPRNILFLNICGHRQSTPCPKQDSFSLYLQSQTINILSKARFFVCISAITVNLHEVQGKILVFICNYSQCTCCPRQDSLSV